MFLGFDLSVQLLILLGIGIQFVLLIFSCCACIKSHVVYKVCSGGLGLLARLNIVHNREVLEQKLRKTIDQYALCIAVIHTAKMAACQSAAAQPIPAGCPDSDYLLCLYECSDGPLLPQCDGKQAFCMTGSNSVPLPGAVGAYEFLYIGVFGGGLNDSMLMTSMMTARGFPIISVLLSAAF